MGPSSMGLKRSMIKNSLVLLKVALDEEEVKLVWYGYISEGQAGV